MGNSFCHDPLGSVPVYETLRGTRVGVVKLVIGLLYLLMMLLTIRWVQASERRARATFHPDATSSVIFPPFVKILWLSALSNAFIGFLMLFVPVEITGDDTHNNLSISVLLYPLAWGLQHFVVEGVACMLMQKGCGVGAARAAFRQSLCWGVVTFVMQTGVYSASKHTTAVIFQVVWSCMLLLFFLLLWILPPHRLFRRPAAVSYARFWFLFRVVTLLCFIAAESNIKVLEEVGSCGYVFLPLLGFPILQPLVCYRTLLEDSLWWQGAFLSEFDEDDDSPLFGIDLTLDTAIALAEVLDHISSSKSAKLINFAHIQTDWKLIGQGSFSKVFAGSYKHVPCALKLVFTTDLTPEDVNKATIEATLLSSIRSRNIINIFGICVNPPSVMIALELCELGSLYDVLRNQRLHLSKQDRLFLALGCCRGLHALHSLNTNIVHRDIKSMNFLVDSHLNAKLCDLELGQNETMSKKMLTENESEKYLLNWMAPEFIQFKQYTRSSDIYALALVLWEILSNEVPYSNLNQQQIRLRVGGKEALRPPLATSWDASYCQLLTLGWAQEQQCRPSSADMEVAMGSVWRGSFYRRHVLVEFSPALGAALDTALAATSRITAESLGKQLSAARCSEIIRSSENTHHSDTRDIPCEIRESGVKLVNFKQSLNPLLSSQQQDASHSSSSPSDTVSALQHLRQLLQQEAEVVEEGDMHRAGWAHISRLPDPVLLVARRHPHLICGASSAMRALLGVGVGGGEDVVGSTLDSFVVPPREHATVECRGGDEEHAEPIRHTPARSALLTSFYKDMLLPDRAHLVSDLLTYTPQGRGGRQQIKCSVSSFPVHRFQCDPDLSLTANQAEFTAYRDSILDSDELLRLAKTTVKAGGSGVAASGKSDTGDRNSHDGGGGAGAQYVGLLFSRLQ